MSIIQISKIQQRSGDLVDLPQLDEAEFGFATDEKRLFIGKTIGNIENVEVLTSYSDIAFDQIQGVTGNIAIDASVLANGQVLAYDGTNWVNKGGEAGGFIDLGSVSNVAIAGGGVGYTLTTDGTGNLSWTPKGFVTLNILNVTQASTGVLEFTTEYPLSNGTRVTINGIEGNTGFTALNGDDFYLKPIANTLSQYELYQDSLLLTPYDTSALTPAYPFTSVTSTSSSTDEILVANSVSFADNIPVVFVGNLGNSGIQANTTYYVYDVSDSTHIKIATSADGNSANIVQLTNETSINANVYCTSGVVAISIGIQGTAAGGSNTQVQFNNGDVLTGVAGFTYNFNTSTLALTGTANIGNVNVTGGSLTTTSLTTGGNSTAGTITGNWSLTAGSQLRATYADLAEYYSADDHYIPGTVLEFGGDKEVTLAGIESSKLAGIVSSEPAYVMNGNLNADHPVMIALVGRVPVRVVGTVSKGAMLVSAGNGLAKASIVTPKVGTVIGKAIENKIDDGEGVVEVMVGRI